MDDKIKEQEKLIKTDKEKNIFIGVLILIIVLLIVAIFYIVVNKKLDSNVNKNLPKDKENIMDIDDNKNGHDDEKNNVEDKNNTDDKNDSSITNNSVVSVIFNVSNPNDGDKQYTITDKDSINKALMFLDYEITVDRPYGGTNLSGLIINYSDGSKRMAMFNGDNVLYDGEKAYKVPDNKVPGGNFYAYIGQLFNVPGVSKPISGTYSMVYKDDVSSSIKSNKESTITFKNDYTFKLTYNNCAGMIDVTGHYTSSDGVIKLVGLNSKYIDTVLKNLNGQDYIEFVNVNDNEIYIKSPTNFACTDTGNEHGTFKKQ